MTRKVKKVTPLPIPAESKDELQNESDSDDEECISSFRSRKSLKVKLT